MDTSQICVACLASYNNGILYGKWIDATQDESDIVAEIQGILANSPIEGAEEWAVHDYEGFGALKIEEYSELATFL